MINDLWCGDVPLKDWFPDLFAISVEEHALVESFLSLLDNGECVWNHVLLHSFQDWELEMVD